MYLFFLFFRVPASALTTGNKLLTFFCQILHQTLQFFIICHRLAQETIKQTAVNQQTIYLCGEVSSWSWSDTIYQVITQFNQTCRTHGNISEQYWSILDYPGACSVNTLQKHEFINPTDKILYIFRIVNYNIIQQLQPYIKLL